MVHRAGIPQHTSAKPVPVLDMAQPVPAWCGATVNGRGAANECSEHWGGKGRFPCRPLAGPCLEHHCSKTDPISHSSGFSASPLATAEPRLTKSTLLAAVISINAALLALAITCQWLAAHFQLEISCQHLQLMSRSGEQTWRAPLFSLARTLDALRAGCPLCQRHLCAQDRHLGLGRGPTGHWCSR